MEIGDDVALGGFVNVTSGRHQHGIDDPALPIYSKPGRAELVRIGPDAWVGSNCVISANVGRRCVVGSGSTVVKDLPDHGIYAGSPARLIRELA